MLATNILFERLCNDQIIHAQKLNLRSKKRKLKRILKQKNIQKKEEDEDDEGSETSYELFPNSAKFLKQYFNEQNDKEKNLTKVNIKKSDCSIKEMNEKLVDGGEIKLEKNLQTINEVEPIAQRYEIKENVTNRKVLKRIPYKKTKTLKKKCSDNILFAPSYYGQEENGKNESNKICLKKKPQRNNKAKKSKTKKNRMTANLHSVMEDSENSNEILTKENSSDDSDSSIWEDMQRFGYTPTSPEDDKNIEKTKSIKQNKLENEKIFSGFKTISPEDDKNIEKTESIKQNNIVENEKIFSGFNYFLENDEKNAVGNNTVLNDIPNSKIEAIKVSNSENDITSSDITLTSEDSQKKEFDREQEVSEKTKESIQDYFKRKVGPRTYYYLYDIEKLLADDLQSSKYDRLIDQVDQTSNLESERLIAKTNLLITDTIENVISDYNIIEKETKEEEKEETSEDDVEVKPNHDAIKKPLARASSSTDLSSSIDLSDKKLLYIRQPNSISSNRMNSVFFKIMRNNFKTKNVYAWDQFLNFKEIKNYLIEMAKVHPLIFTLETIGLTYEGHAIKVVIISNTPHYTDTIVVEAGIHAREWASPAAAIYIINTLLTNWDTLPTYLTNKTWVFFPLVNPDGYEFTWSVDRLWRKNRKPYSRECYGVDLNRNFDFFWYDCKQDDPCHINYKGSTPFSEKETQAIRDFLTPIKSYLKAYISLHSYGQQIRFQWGISRKIPDARRIQYVAELGALKMSEVQNKEYTVTESESPVFGNSRDWARKELGIKYAYLIELRDTGRYKFLMPESSIIPTSEEALAFIITVAMAIEEDSKNAKLNIQQMKRDYSDDSKYSL